MMPNLAGYSNWEVVEKHPHDGALRAYFGREEVGQPAAF